AARASLGPLTDIVANHREFYDGVLHGVRIPKITGETSFSGVDIYGLEFTLFADDRPVEPRLISSDSSTVQVVDHVYYNGLPADRSRYLTLMVGEGSRLALRIKNTSQDRLYAVVPTINGIPFRVKSLQLWYGGFEKGVLPVTGIAPDVTYLKPGQEHDYNGFFCNSIKIARGPDPMSHYNCIDDFGTSEELFALSFMFSQIFRRNMTEKDIALLEKLDNPEIAQKVMYESRLHAVRQFLKFLDQATETDIYVARPVPADSKASSELDNPYLGSIGIAVVEVSPPPVEARHEISYGGHYNQSKGGEAAMGVGGLAEIAGRRARAADKVDFWDSMRHDAMIHKFAGYVPVNLMSLRK
ncbi:hypothetical protein HYX09_00235, partial [Candidatus Woesearchaeota archaeon]|nr:hypothetical protein [Candidatus Woesearchaeota archaeon]